MTTGAKNFENTKEYQEKIEKEKSVKALGKAKMLESELKKKNWRYVKVKPTLEILVPCDKHGKPTKEGQQKINFILNR